MANEYIQKDFAGGAAATAITSSINTTALSFAVGDGSSYPTGPTPFVIVVDRGLATEEKMLVGSRASNTFTITERGYDGSSAQSHASGAIVEHCLDAHTIYQANRLANLQTTKGDLIGYSGTTTNRVAAGANNTVLVADSAQTNGIKWAATLSGLTLTSPTVNTPTVSTPAITNGTVDAAAITNGSLTAAVVDQLEENWNVVASAATGTINFDLKTASIWYYTSDASANHTINVRGDGSTTLSSLLAVGDSVTVVWANTNGATPYWPSTLQIDGTTVTPKWQGGTAPTGGNASSLDVYTYVIVKTAATPTYTVLASQTMFA